MKQITTLLTCLLISTICTVAQKQQSQYTLLYNILDEDNNWAMVSKCSLQQTAGAGDTLLDVVVPDSVILNGKVYAVAAINDKAFSLCFNLGKVHLPSTLRKIGGGAFAGCYNIRFEIDEDNPSYSVKDGIIFSKDYKTLVTYPESAGKLYSVPEGVDSIAPYAVAYNNYCDALMTIPASVRAVGKGAFYGVDDILEITVPEAVEKIGDRAFGIYNLYAIHLPNPVNLKLENIGDEFVNDRTGVYVPDKYYDYYKNLLSKKNNTWRRGYSIIKESEFQPLKCRTVEDITLKLLGEIAYKGSIWTLKKEAIERLAKKSKILLAQGASAPDHSMANNQQAYINIPSVGNVKVALSRFYYSPVDGHCTALETKIDCYKDEFKVATYIESQLPKSYKEIAGSQQYPRVALFQDDTTKNIVCLAPDERRHEVFVLLLPENGEMLKKIKKTFKITF